MSVALITQPAFLHKHFLYTRKGLLGQWPPKKTVAKSRIQSVQEPLPEIETISAPSVAEVESFQPFSEPTIAFQPEEIIQVPLVAGVVDVVSPAPQTEVITTVSSKEVAKSRPATTAVKSITRFLLTVVMIIGLGVGAVLILPEVYYKVFSQSTAVGEVADAAKNAAQAQPTNTPEPQPYMPPKNPDLPMGTWISIPRIGVNSEAFPTADSNEALDKGIWLVPDFGRPGDTTQPMIVAAHRFGWDWWWKTDYWKYHSFYLLTDTQPGDRVEVIYDQRKWVYEIYAGEEGDLITDYDADLILYTCKYLNSPIRYFRYAKLIEE